MIDNNDWRLSFGRKETYLTKAKLKYISEFKKFSETWDHEHCEFCMDKFMEVEGFLHEGYCTLDEKSWICLECFKDFKEMFQWEVVEQDGSATND